MLAISNSVLWRMLRRGNERGERLFPFPAAVTLAFAFLACPAPAAEASVASPRSTALSQARQRLEAAEKRFQIESESAEAAWHLARACFNLAELATNQTQRAQLAQRGIGACRAGIDHVPDDAGVHYYLAMNLGQLARTKGLGALKIVREMEREFERTRELDPAFDFAGPDRNLGLLYQQAPGWPASIGSRKKARAHFLQAINLCPEYPGNHLRLLEAHLGWDERKAVRDRLPSVERVLTAARAKLTGDEWTQSWIEWDERWEEIKRRAYELPKPSGAPRQRQD